MLSNRTILYSLLLLGALTSITVAQTSEVGKPYYLTAGDLSIATGNPSLQLMSHGSTHIPIWSLSGGTVGQSVVGVVPPFSNDCGGVKVEIVVTTTDPETSSKFEDVYRVHLSQMVEGDVFTSRKVTGDCVRTPLPDGPFHTRTIILESFYEIEPNSPLTVRIQREPDDPADTFTRPTGLAMVKITPLAAPAKPHVAQEAVGYNSWPVIQAVGNKLVCVYSRGTGHNWNSGQRATYTRSSSDNGKTWTPETLVADTPGYCESVIGKGLDSTGAALFWVRRIREKEWNHDLYRSTDGMTFTRLASLQPEVMPIQITDVFTVPKVGLMALWFAGMYNDKEACHSWGTLTSADDGKTWTQIVATDPLAGWIFVLDNLNTHVSATLVYLIAMLCGIPFESLGEKGKTGVLKNKESRKRFLEDESHRIRFALYNKYGTPKHCSWLNQIENWFSGLGRRVLNRGSFTSVDDLNAALLSYIDFYNATAKPTEWKYDGTPKNKTTNII